MIEKIMKDIVKRDLDKMLLKLERAEESINKLKRLKQYSNKMMNLDEHYNK